MKTAPVVYLRSWRLLAVMAFLLFFVWMGVRAFGYPTGLFSAVAVFLAWALGIRHWLHADYYRAIRRYRRREFEAAIPYFERAFQFLQNHRWIDDWRIVVTLSSTPFPLRSVCQHGLGICQLKLGRIDQAKSSFQQALAIAPKNWIAEGSLENIEIIENASNPKTPPDPTMPLS